MRKVLPEDLGGKAIVIDHASSVTFNAEDTDTQGDEAAKEDTPAVHTYFHGKQNEEDDERDGGGFALVRFGVVHFPSLPPLFDEKACLADLPTSTTACDFVDGGRQFRFVYVLSGPRHTCSGQNLLNLLRILFEQSNTIETDVVIGGDGRILFGDLSNELAAPCPAHPRR